MKKFETKEEEIYYNSLSRNEKISYTLLHKSEDEKDKSTQKRLESRAKWSEEQRKKIFEKISKTKTNKTPEEKEQQIEKFRNTICNKSQGEKDLTHIRRSEATKNHFNNMTDEEREAFSKKMSSVYHSQSDEWKKSRSDKIVSTMNRRYGKSWSTDIVIKGKEKLIETNMEKYGVPYYCMTDTCRSARGGNSKNSSKNLGFQGLLNDNAIGFEQEFVLGTYSYDFKVGNNLIEINPTITHNSTMSPYNTPKDKNYHYMKTLFAKENGYRCINVWDWDDISKIIGLLKDREVIYGRQCVVTEIDKKTATNFLKAYHLQGSCNDIIRIGLYYNNELVSVMTLGKPRYSQKYSYELLRYCSSVNVIGGAEKLFSFFIRIKTKPGDTIISYCDLSKFTGDVYRKLGFIDDGFSIGKHWYNIKTKEHITNNLLLQRGFDQLLGSRYGVFGKGTNNEELMLNNGFVVVYDSGQAKYVKTI